MKNQKGVISLFALIVIIAGVLVLGGGYFGVRKYQTYQDKQTEKQAQVLVEAQRKLEQDQISKDKDILPAPSLPVAPTSTRNAKRSTVVSSTLTPTLEPKLSYEDLHCPKVIKLEDSLGNTSDNRYLSGIFKKGDIKTITIKVTASDPQNDTLYYQFSDEGTLTTTPHTDWSAWSTNNSITLNLKDDIGSGINKSWVTYRIDNRDGFSCYFDVDYQGVVTYTVFP